MLNHKIYKNGAEMNEPKEGPNVSAALSGTPGETGAPRKSTIGQRKPAAKVRV